MSGQVHPEGEWRSAVIGSQDPFKLRRPAVGQCENQPFRVRLSFRKVTEFQALQEFRFAALVVTQHRVAQAPRPALVQLAGCIDCFVNRGVIRYTHEFELVKTEYEQAS